MPDSVHYSDGQAGVLNGAGRILQPCARNADSGLFHLCHERRKPLRHKRHYVVVEEDQYVSAGMPLRTSVALIPLGGNRRRITVGHFFW
jgi:hypothetical protein